MATYRAHVTSLRPQAEVFDYMARFSNAAEWDPGVTEATEVDPGAPTLGSTYRGSTLIYDATLGLKGAAALLTPLLGLSFRRIGDRAIVGLRAALTA